MTEITVIETAPILSDIAALSYEELELVLRQIGDNYPGIESSHFDKLREIISWESKKKALTDKPKLVELILRYVIGFPHVVCVIRGYPEQTIYKPVVRTTAKKPPLPNSIVLTVDKNVFCITRDTSQTYVARKGTEIEVVGVIVAHTHYNITQLRGSSVETFYPLYTANIPSRDLISTGSFSIGRFTSALDTGVSPRASESSAETPSKETPSKETQQMMQRSYLNGHQNEYSVFMFDKTRDQTIGHLFNIVSAIPKYVWNGATEQYAQYNLENRTVAAAKLGRKITPIPLTPSAYLEIGKLAPLLKRIESLIKIKTALSFTDVVYSDLASVGLENAWFIAQHTGADSAKIAELFATYQTKRARAELIREIERKKLDDIYLISLYKLVVGEKLGKARYLQFASKIDPNITSAEAKKLLTTGEQKIVDLEIKRKNNYYNAVITNKCPHIKTLSQFRRARDDRVLKRVMGELEKFFQLSGPKGAVGNSKRNINPKSRVSATGAAAPRNQKKRGFAAHKSLDLPKEMIGCNNCGFDLLCPHVHELTQLRLERAGYRNIRGAMEKYIDKMPVQGSFFCSICGEVIVSREEFEESEVPRAAEFDESDEIRKLLYAEFRLINSYLTFSAVMNVPAFIKNGIEACYMFLFEIEKELLRIKSNTAVEIKNKLKLFTTILAFAYIVHVIESNDFSSVIQFKNMKPSKKITDYLTFAVRKAVDMRSVVMNEITGANSVFVKNKLVERYRVFRQGGAIPLALSDAESLVYVGLYTDPVYWYYNYVLSIDRRQYIGWNIPKVMGASLAELKDKPIYASVNTPKISKWHTSGFDTVSQWKGKSYGAEQTYQAGLEGNTARVWEMFHKYISQKMYQLQLYTSDGLNSAFEKLHAEGRKLIETENKLYSWKTASTMRPRLLLEAKQNKRFALSEMCLGRIYDEYGRRHKWDTFIDSKKHAHSNADLADAIQKELKIQIVDVQCSICKVLKSKTCDLDEKKIKHALSERTFIQNFFKFFENRCPAGGLHEYSESKCKKCSYDQIEFPASAVSYPLDKTAGAYLTKYKPKYESELKLIASTEEELTPQKKITRGIPHEKFVQKYQYNFNVLLDVSNKLSVDVNLLTALGDTFKKDYKEVKSGKYVPREPTTRWNHRVEIVDSYVKLLITDYNRLRHYHKIHRPSSAHKLMLEKSGISKFDYNKLSDMLPSIFDDYYTKLVSFKRAGKPAQTLNFVIESLCAMLMKIYRDKNPKTRKLREAYAKYMIDRVLTNERNITKHERFDWTVMTVRGDKLFSEDDRDSNTSKADDAVSMSGVDLDELDEEERAAITDTSTMFDTSAYDVEDSPYGGDGDDGDDGEDNGMFKAVGYGID